MTTAHRATWRTARAGDNEAGSFRLHVGTAQQSAKAAPGHRLLKERDDGSVPMDRAALRAALEAREAGAPLPDAFAPVQSTVIRALDDDAELDDDDADTEGGPRKRLRLQRDDEAGHSENDDSDEDDDDGDEDDDEDDDDDDDDDEALLAELEKIRAERAAERERKAAEKREELELQEETRAATGNPLLGNVTDDDTASVVTSAASFAVKRRWNDDVVFKDQARGERKSEQRFVNDTIRNDFHRRFLKRYIR